jgi:Uma2 family endonuclease
MEVRMSAEAIPYVTPQEYLSIERAAEYRSEYFEGQMFAMSGAKRPHNLITTNLVWALKGRLRGGPCEVYPGAMRVKVRATGLYTYPDVVVACGEREFEDEDEDTLFNPTAVFEVLSPTTEAYDRGGKFAHYRMVDSLQVYVLVAQNHCMVERFARQANGGWGFAALASLEESLELGALGCSLPLAEIYDGVGLDAGQPTPPGAIP